MNGDTEVDALRTDRYLDSLLAAADRGASHVPTDTAIDDRVRTIVARLRRDLVRVHPSFRFEERLATRLGNEAATMRLAPAAGGGGSITAIPLAADEPADDEGFRPLLIGGALTSAALSIAGAAYVAWRRARPSRPGLRAGLHPGPLPIDAVARAVRATRTSRQRRDRRRTAAH
jgi:hypothetical protein